MSLKTSFANILYKGISSGKLSFHDAIKLYRKLNYFLSYKRCPSQKFGSRLVVEYIKNATASDTKRALTSVAFPAEILFAFGIYPLTLEVLAGTFSSLRLAKPFLDAADNSDIPNTLCSFHRMLLGISQKGILGKPCAVGATSIFCDGNVKSFAEVARKYQVPFIFFDIPYEVSAPAVSYVKEQLNKAIKQLAEITGIDNYEDRLFEIVNNVNNTLNLFRKFYELRKNSTKNLYRGHEIANFCFPNHFMLGTEELMKLMNKRCEDEIQGTRQNRFYKNLNFNKETRRLMWLHIVPQYDWPIWNIIDDGMRAKVVCDEYSSVRYDDYDLNDPLASIAKRLINHPTNGPLKRRVDFIINVARDFNVDGIIHYSSWGCHQAAGNIYLLGKHLEDAGFKFLNLNGDAVDQRNSSIEQHRTRIEAFLENW